MQLSQRSKKVYKTILKYSDIFDYNRLILN